MLRNYWKTLLSPKIGKTNFPSKNTAARLYGCPIYLLKNKPFNIVISMSYRLLTGANRTTVCTLKLIDSDNRWQNELRHFALNWAFLHFTDFKRRKYRFFSPPFSPCNLVPMFGLPIENNKHPNFEWRGQGRGVDSFVLWVCPIWVQCLNNFVADFRVSTYIIWPHLLYSVSLRKYAFSMLGCRSTWWSLVPYFCSWVTRIS